MFLHVSVCPQGEGGIPACLAGGIPACLAGLQGGVSQHALQVSRPTPKGELEGSGQGGLRGLARGLQVHTQGGGGLQAHTQVRGVSQHALRQTPLPRLTATVAGGTHPTGMHSCNTNVWSHLCFM